jgi:stringent starvation protein B
MKIIEKIFNVETGEETIFERDETSAEKKIREQDEKEFAAIEAEAKVKAEQRQEILDRLGLTADEAKLLLG